MHFRQNVKKIIKKIICWSGIMPYTDLMVGRNGFMDVFGMLTG